MSTVVIGKADKEIDEAQIFLTVKRVFKKAGLDRYIKAGQNVLIKPNLVAVPPERISGAVTLAEVSEAVALMVNKAGANPVIADSSAVGVDTEDVIQTAGYDKLRQKGYKIKDLKKDKIVKFNGIKIFETVKNIDVIISVPVMKTHDQFEVSLGVKNLKGLLPDSEKKDFHNKYNLADSLTDLIKILMLEKQVLTVMDAVVALEGRGPVFGKAVKTGVILAGDDIVAVDSIASMMMGVKESELTIEKKASKKGLGTVHRDKIKISGDYSNINELPVKNFDRGKDISINARNFEMFFSDKTCTGCKNTVISCLYEIKENSMEPKLAGKKILAGKDFLDSYPGFLSKSLTLAEELILVGRCVLQFENLKNIRLTQVPGCPPENKKVLEALLKD